MPQFRTFDYGASVGKGQQLAENRFRLGEAKRARDVRAETEQAVRTGETGQFEQRFPIEASQYKSNLEKSKLEDALQKVKLVGNVASGMNPQNYTDGLRRLKEMGADVSTAPPQYDPQWIQSRIQEAYGYEGQMKMALERMKQKSRDTRTSLQKNIPVLMRNLNMSRQEATRLLSQTKQKSPEQFKADMFARYTSSQFMDPEEAKAQAEKATELLYPDYKPTPDSGVKASDIKPGEPTATGPGGKKVVLRNGQWLPVQ